MKRGCFFCIFFNKKAKKIFFLSILREKWYSNVLLLEKKDNRLFNLYEYGKKVIIRI